ncbi:MAG: hypothetical protein JWP63_4716, partial [Candidatus Solibacter sp.]|nr:hypothetical protein [Candidatus Solibacter sp.]
MRVDGPPSFIAPTVSSDSLSFFMVLGDKAAPLQTLSVTPGSGDVRIVSDSEWLKFNQRSLSFLDVAAKLLEGAISAGEMVRLGGNNLACDATARVLVDGDAAQVLSANANEIRLIVPDSVSGKN